MDEKGKFVRVVCVRCGWGQVVYGKASTRVKCLRCNRLLARNSGGKIRIKTVVKKVLM